MTFELVPLRVPVGWTIEWNVFTEVSPEDFTDAEHEHRWEYNEDLFQSVNYNRRKILDLGWYPEFQPNGLSKKGKVAKVKFGTVGALATAFVTGFQPRSAV